MLLEGFVYVLTERVQFRIQGELVPDVGLFDPGRVCHDLWRRIGIGGFGEGCFR